MYGHQTPQLQLAQQIWHAGVAAVAGESSTRSTLAQFGSGPWQSMLAIGKAASSMMMGALSYLDENGSALVVTKYGHTDSLICKDKRIRVIESGHPMPDENSLIAGEAVTTFVGDLVVDAELLVLVSGGASSLVEYLEEGMDLSALQALSHTLLADGYSIDQINCIRIGVSKIKGGKLLRQFAGRKIQVLGLSDIPGDESNLIGSGIAAIDPPKVKQFHIPSSIQQVLARAGSNSSNELDALSFEYHSTLVGSNLICREAAAEAARQLGLSVVESHELLQGDVIELATTLCQRLSQGKSGVYIWGGESTVQLPPNPGQGGRNQSLAIALAIALNRTGQSDHGLNVCAVVAGTDGSDGPTSAAGGSIFKGMNLDGAADALSRADAGPWLKNKNALFVTGPTGTNVMDLIITIKS